MTRAIEPSDMTRLDLLVEVMKIKVKLEFLGALTRDGDDFTIDESRAEPYTVRRLQEMIEELESRPSPVIVG